MAKSFHCEVCLCSFGQRHHVERHVRTVHENHRRFPCTECPKAFARQDVLDRHVRTTHENEKDRPYRCAECTDAFGRSDHLQHHLKTVHGAGKTVQCAECESTFGQRVHLVRHMKTVHGDRNRFENRFECSECRVTFDRQDVLMRHMRNVHLQQKPFSCTECGGSFKRREHLERHRKTVHGKLKPFQCADCPKRFGEKRHLNEHIKRIRDDVKQYECPVCHRRFAIQKDLNAHSITHCRGVECKARNKSKRSAKKSAGAPPPNKRVKDEIMSNEESLDDSLDVAEGVEHSEPTVADDTDSMRSCDEYVEDSSKLVLRLRSTVQFKTSGGRVLVVKNQPASMTFGAFRKLFGIPSDAITLVAFKEKDAKGFEQWIVSAGDDMLVPLFDGRIVAETCTDF
ncbi:gastrula zinc finger protein XlCGF57.1-like protein [Aphelenchoides avenae]|nr:gastrula zinc finger protein XlCGF57.1-like protein [Aphelenchus avenae]